MKGECSLTSDLTSQYSSNTFHRNFSILSSGDVHLGELNVLFQLHIRPPLNKRDASPKKQAGVKSFNKPEAKPSDTAAEFIVGPGATFKRSPPAPVQHRQLEKTCKDIKSKEDKPEVMSVSVQKPKAVTVGGAGSDTGCKKVTFERDKPVPVIGKQQLQVISELLERGTTLRDRMVHSLAAGTQLEQRWAVCTLLEDALVLKLGGLIYHGCLQ